MVAPVIPNVTAPIGIVLIDPTTGLPYVAGGGGFGTYLSATVGAGATNNFSPAGWPTGVGRLDINPSSGNANITGLVAGSDAQSVLITNVNATNTLTLNALNAGSLAANQFRYAGDLILPTNATVLAVYYAGTVNNWVLR